MSLHSGEHPYSTLHTCVLCHSPGRPCCRHPVCLPSSHLLPCRDKREARTATGCAKGPVQPEVLLGFCRVAGQAQCKEARAGLGLLTAATPFSKAFPPANRHPHNRDQEGVKGNSYWTWVVQVHSEPVLQPGFAQPSQAKRTQGKASLHPLANDLVSLQELLSSLARELCTSSQPKERNVNSPSNLKTSDK